MASGKRKSKKSPKKKSPKKKPARRAASASRSAFRKPGGPLLGEIRVPSGQLAIFDIGLAGFLPREALAPMIVTAPVPRDRMLSVVGTPIGKGRYADCWDHVSVMLGDGEVAASKKLGEAAVDFARLVCMDVGALEHWVHEDSLDGRADFVFWGRDAAQLAKVVGAKRVGDGNFGWLDLPVADAEKRADDAARRKSANKWLLQTDYRPHSHHYQALAAARAGKHGAGTLALADTQLVLFFTSWGDGVFPVFLDVDGND
jgi:hypothetical protein